MDLYRVLELHESASQDQVKQAYRRLARTHHPDKNLGSLHANDSRFKDISHAYEILSDPREREKYDRSRRPPADFHFTPAQDLFESFFGHDFDPFFSTSLFPSTFASPTPPHDTFASIRRSMMQQDDSLFQSDPFFASSFPTLAGSLFNSPSSNSQRTQSFSSSSNMPGNGTSRTTQSFSSSSNMPGNTTSTSRTTRTVYVNGRAVSEVVTRTVVNGVESVTVERSDSRDPRRTQVSDGTGNGRRIDIN